MEVNLLAFNTMQEVEDPVAAPVGVAVQGKFTESFKGQVSLVTFLDSW